MVWYGTEQVSTEYGGGVCDAMGAMSCRACVVSWCSDVALTRAVSSFVFCLLSSVCFYTLSVCPSSCYSQVSAWSDRPVITVNQSIHQYSSINGWL